LGLDPVSFKGQMTNTLLQKVVNIENTVQN